MNNLKLPFINFGLLFVIFLFACQPADKENTNLTEAEKEKAKALFIWQCSRCHGVEGNGGNGPSLRRQYLTHAPDDEALYRLIRSGLPGTEMPGTWMMSDQEVKLVGQYVRSLGQIMAEGEIAGNIEDGKTLYNQKGNCGSCHIIDGLGTGIGPILSAVGARRNPSFLREAIINPGKPKEKEEVSLSADGFEDYLVVHVITKDGQSFQGYRVNEDAFSIQLKNANNVFRSFDKRKLQSLTKEFGKSLMPSFKEVFTESELDDLVAYLYHLKGKQ